MKNGIFKIKDNYLDFLIIINILYILIHTYLYTVGLSFNLKSMSSGFITLEIFNYIIIFINFIKYKFHRVDISIILIIIISLLSTCFAFNQDVALFGYSRRYEGLFSILYYLSLLFLSTFSKNKKLIIYFILFAGICPFIYSFCFHFHLFNINSFPARHNIWQKGFTTNANFYGSFMLICLSYSIGLFIDESNTDEDKLINFLLIFIFSIGLLYSNTFSCFLGFLMVLIILFIYCLKNHKIKKFLFLLMIFLFVFIFMAYKKTTHIHSDISVFNQEIVSISKGELKDNYGSYRGFILKEAIVEVPKYFFFGIGLDNFGFIKDGDAIRLTTEKGTALFDKAHCEYLQQLITGGLFYLLSYILLYIIVLINGFRLAFSKRNIYLILPIVGYLIQAMFNISVIEVAPFFFISMGFVIDREIRKKICNQ